MHLLLAANKSFWHDHGDEISALITLLLAVIVAFLVDRLVIGRGTRVAERMTDGGVSRSAATRLRVVRRLVFVAILVIGLVIGFAARQSIGNMVAGVMLAITQPMRIGDRVTFEDTTGRVDDITLTYTYLDPGDGRLVVVPNESIVSGTIFNHSTGDRGAPVTVSAWVPLDTDLHRAEEALKGAGADTVQVAEWTHEGVRLEVKVATDANRTRVGDEEAALRERAQSALQGAGLLA